MAAYNKQNYLTVDELAKSLSVAPKTIYRLVQSGKLPGFKIGNQWRFDIRILEEWVRKQSRL